MRTTKSERAFNAVNAVLLIMGATICVLPFLHVMAQSLSSHHAITSGSVTIFPVELTFDSYRELFQGTRIIPSFINSVYITVVGVAASMVCTILTAYPLSRKHFFGRKFFTKAIIFTMMFNGGLIPTYLQMRSLGLVNTYFALWLLNLINPYNMIIMRGSFDSIPSELVDAARIDGCGEMRTMLNIYLPLSKAMLVTVGMFYMIYYWDLFQGVMVYISDTKKYNLVVLVQQLIQQNTLLDSVNHRIDDKNIQMVPEMIKAAGVMVMVIPIICVYPFIQRFFVKGVMLGSIKG